MSSLFGFSGYGGLFRAGLGSSSSFYSNLAQYSSIRSGAYAKATKAYYAKNAKTDTKSTTKSTSSDKTYNYSKYLTTDSVLSNVKTEATELVDSAKKLTSTGKDSVFSDKNGYDKDAAYKAVKDFVTDYNDTVGALGDTTNSNVKNAGNSLTRITNVMSSSLSKVGVTVGTDGKLSIDEEAFKSADESKVKSLFGASGSYASLISSSASRVASQAARGMTQYSTSLYGSSGSYYNSFNSGLWYNGYF